VSDRPTPVIVYLSGHLRGKTHRLFGEQLRIGTTGTADIQVSEHELPPGAADVVHRGELALLVLRGQTYELEVAPGAEVWVNGERVERRVLASGDLLEIGEGGPVLRFRLYEPGTQPYKSMGEVFSDCRDCVRHGGRSFFQRMRIMLFGAPLDLATQTSPRFRINLVIALVLLVGMMGALTWRNFRLEDRLAEERERRAALEGLVAKLSEQGENYSYSAADLADARRGLEDRLIETMARLEALESRAGSRERVISSAAQSVVFLQGGYGFMEATSGRPLRLGSPSEPSKLPGVPPVTLDGSGPIIEILYTGTAFVATDDGLLLSNRHVALPWEFDETAQLVVQQGYLPVMQRFRGFLPGRIEPFDVELVRSSNEADVAVLRCVLDPGEALPLPLRPDRPHIGEEVIVLGYPTGMHALMARADASFVEAMLAVGSLNFWQLAERLAAGGYIAPLATLGIVGQVTPGAVVYDAETTHGGSGGPVLNLDGGVVAVNAAVVPEFGGSNLGVPAEAAAVLLLAPERAP
jgi:S1-C subfamily serine protease